MNGASIHRYSPIVRLTLLAGGRSYRVAESAANRCILREPADIPPGPAELVMLVDGQEQRWSLVLPRGASCASPLVEISLAGANGGQGTGEQGSGDSHSNLTETRNLKPEAQSPKPET